MTRTAAFLVACAVSVAVFPSCAPLYRAPSEEPALPPMPAPKPPPGAKPPPVPAPTARLRERERRALELARRGELAQALIAWRVLQVLDPQNPEYSRQVSATETLVRQRVAQHLRAGRAARAAGDPSRARLEYLKALALDPRNTKPLGPLREIDRDQALAAQGERLERLVAQRHGAEKAGKGAGVGQQERDYLETGIALFKQGEYEESALEIQKYLQSFPNDPEARRYLEDARRMLGNRSEPETGAPPPGPPTAEPASPGPTPASAVETQPTQEAPKPSEADRGLAQDLYEKGLRASKTSISRAIEYWEQALRLDPDHVQARLHLERAWRMQRTLEEIPEK